MDIFRLKKKIEPLGFSVGYEEPSPAIILRNYEDGSEYRLKKNVDVEDFYKKVLESKKLSLDFLMSFFKIYDDPIENGVDL